MPPARGHVGAEGAEDYHEERVCTVIEGDAGASWFADREDRTWTEGGSYFAVRVSDVGSGVGVVEGPQTSPDAARRNAVATAYRFAFQRLASRGVSYEDWQLKRMVEDRVEAVMRGDEVDFPRVKIDGMVVEECSRRGGGAETYRASVLAEYPISHLRGDVNNAELYGQRVRNEAGVLVSSARSLFADGRWLEALVELGKARDLLDTACRQPVGESASEEVGSLMDWAAGSLGVESIGGVQVLDVGERREVEIPFRWSYEWNGRRVMASRLPVSFRPHGFDAVFDNDSETDDSGTASCRVVVAYGEPGEHAIEPRLDFDVISAALGGDYADRIEPFSGPLRRVFLVEGAHALSVCLEIEGVGSADAAQLRAGFARRMEREGFSLEECGADVHVVVSARVELKSGAVGEQWTASASVAASAFDQRTALVIGRPSVLANETAPEGRRESEVLALKEAGRLLAAYLTDRILMSGE